MPVSDDDFTPVRQPLREERPPPAERTAALGSPPPEKTAALAKPHPNTVTTPHKAPAATEDESGNVAHCCNPGCAVERVEGETLRVHLARGTRQVLCSHCGTPAQYVTPEGWAALQKGARASKNVDAEARELRRG